MSVGTINRAQVANICFPAGERPNKTPIFISGVRHARAFLFWLRASCPGDLTYQLKAEKLMVVPSTANDFRAAVSALRSLDGEEGVSFHTFTLPEDHCVQLLVKNLGRGMPESVIREELEALDIHIQGVMQLRSFRRDQDPTKDHPLTPTSLYQWRGGPRYLRCDLSPNSAVCEFRWIRRWLKRARCYASPASALDTRSETANTRPGASRVVASTSPLGAQPGGSSISAVAAGATTQRVTVPVSSRNKRRRPLQSERQRVCERAPLLSTPLLLKPSWRIWARDGITSTEGGVLSRPPPYHHQILNPLLSRLRRRPRSLK